MTSVRWAVFGESGSDKTFLEALLRHLGMTGIEIETIEGGVSHLRHVATQIRRRGDSGRRVALLLDAKNQPEKRRKEAVQEVERLDLPVSRIILLPSDEQPGDLETVLEGLAVARHRVIYDCFEQYELCVRKHSESSVLPNRKAKVFAYCEAVRAESHPEKRDYNNSEHWDLNAAILEPLREALLSLGQG